MDFVQILLIAAIVVWIIAKRFSGSPVGGRSLLVPLIMVGYGLVQLDDAHAWGVASVTLLAVEAIVAVAAGVARGVTIELYVRDGHLWQRYRLVTLMVWIGMIALRLGFLAAGHALGASLPETGTILLTFGVSMLIETLVVARRAAATGAAIMPRRSRSTSIGARQ
jgi:hypothetical protein